MIGRGWLYLGLVVLLLGSTGCIAATVKNNRFGTDREVVAVDGQVYIVDKANGNVMKVDVATAGPFVATEEPE